MLLTLADLIKKLSNGPERYNHWISTGNISCQQQSLPLQVDNIHILRSEQQSQWIHWHNIIYGITPDIDITQDTKLFVHQVSRQTYPKSIILISIIFFGQL